MRLVMDEKQRDISQNAAFKFLDNRKAIMKKL